MTRPSDIILERYLADDLVPAERRRVDAYLASGGEGRARLEELRALRQQFLSAEPPERFAHKLATRLAVEEQRASSRPWIRWLLGPSLVAALGAAAVVVMVTTSEEKGTVPALEDAFDSRSAQQSAPGDSMSSAQPVEKPKTDPQPTSEHRQKESAASDKGDGERRVRQLPTGLADALKDLADGGTGSGGGAPFGITGSGRGGGGLGVSGEKKKSKAPRVRREQTPPKDSYGSAEREFSRDDMLDRAPHAEAPSEEPASSEEANGASELKFAEPPSKAEGTKNQLQTTRDARSVSAPRSQTDVAVKGAGVRAVTLAARKDRSLLLRVDVADPVYLAVVSRYRGNYRVEFSARVQPGGGRVFLPIQWRGEGRYEVMVAADGKPVSAAILSKRWESKPKAVPEIAGARIFFTDTVWRSSVQEHDSAVQE